MKNSKSQQEPLDAFSVTPEEEPNAGGIITSAEQVVSGNAEIKKARKKKKADEEQPAAASPMLPEEELHRPETPVGEQEIDHLPAGKINRLPLIGALVGGLIVGFLLGYFLFTLPLQNQLANVTLENFNGNSSSNSMKSDLSTTKLKQQEMEIRYQAVTGQLESANQYIFLLRMKEQISFARLMVEQKDGITARQTLSEIQSRFDHLKPFVLQKDSSAANKIDELIKQSIQHLASDPEAVKSDLAEISIQLNKIESTLFQPD